MSRFTISTVLAAAALVVPATAVAAPIDASAHLEAHAVADSAQAVRLAKNAAGRAREAVQRSTAELKRAHAMTVAHSQQASADGSAMSAQFSAAAEAQGQNLADVVESSQGRLKRAAADALAKTTALQAGLAKKVAAQLERQNEAATSQQGDDVTQVGGSNASLAATVAVTVSGENLKQGLRRQLDKVTDAAMVAQAKLIAAVADLRQRTESDGQGNMAATQSSLQQGGCDMARAIRRSGRTDTAFSKSWSSDDGSAAASLSGEAHVRVDDGGSC